MAEVADEQALVSALVGLGVGLANARTRLYLLFGPEASLDLTAPTPGRVQARVRLPAPLAPSPTEPLPSS